MSHVDHERLEIGAHLYTIDVDEWAHRFTYPAPGKTTGKLHDQKVPRPEPVITIGYGPDFAVLRSDGVRLDIPQMVTELNEEVDGGGVSGGGHLVVGSIKFVKGCREQSSTPSSRRWPKPKSTRSSEVRRHAVKKCRPSPPCAADRDAVCVRFKRDPTSGEHGTTIVVTDSDDTDLAVNPPAARQRQRRAELVGRVAAVQHQYDLSVRSRRLFVQVRLPTTARLSSITAPLARIRVERASGAATSPSAARRCGRPTLEGAVLSACSPRGRTRRHSTGDGPQRRATQPGGAPAKAGCSSPRPSAG